MAQLTFQVTGMHCGSCALLIDETLGEMPGVASAQSSFDEGRTVVDHDPALTSPEALAGAIAGLGYKAEPVSA